MTLIEVAIAVVVIGLTAVGVLQLLAVCSKGNSDLSATTTLMTIARASQEYVHSKTYADLQAWATTGVPTYSSPVDAAGNTLTLSIGRINLGNGMSFTSAIKMLRTTSDPSLPEFALTVTGIYYTGTLVNGNPPPGTAVPTKVVGTNIDASGSSSLFMADVPMLAHGGISFKGNSGIYDSSASPIVAGTPIDLQNGTVLWFDSSGPQPTAQQTIAFPPKYLDDSVYTQLNSMKTSGALTTFSQPQSAPDKKGKTTPIPVSSLQNVYIPPNTTTAFTDNLAMNGIIYVGYPNTITFGNNVTFNGVIIYEKPASEPTLTANANYLLDFNRALQVTQNADATQQNVQAALTSAGLSAQAVSDYWNKIYPWVIHAPNTDMDMQNGNTTGNRDFFGWFHLRSIDKATGQGGGSATDMEIHGRILTEGTVELGGNRKFSIYATGTGGPGMNDPGYSLQVAQHGYWELH